MQRTFSYALLITCFLLAVSCKSHYISTSVNTQNLFVSDKVNQLDSQVGRMYLPFKNQIEKDMKWVIAFSEIEMIKKKPESSLTNFLADLLLEEGIAVAQKNGLDAEPVVSYLNYGGIRTFLPKRDISVENAFELMPFENEMVYLEKPIIQINKAGRQVIVNQVWRGGLVIGKIDFVFERSRSKGKVIFVDKIYT